MKKIKINEDLLFIAISTMFCLLCIYIAYSNNGKGIEGIIFVPLSGFCGIAVIVAFARFIIRKYDIRIEIKKENK